MTDTRPPTTFRALLNALFARITAEGSPEDSAWSVVHKWVESMGNPHLREYLDWEATEGFDDGAARAMFSLAPYDIAVLLGPNAKARKAVLQALEQRLEREASEDINWQDYLRDPQG